MEKLDGKIAVITGGSSGMALATAQLLVEEGAYVFITGRRQKALDEAAKLIGRNITGVQGDASNFDDLDRLYATVKGENGSIDVLFASAGMGEARKHHYSARCVLSSKPSIVSNCTRANFFPGPLYRTDGRRVLQPSPASVAPGR